MSCKYKTEQGCKWVFEKTGEWRHLPASICKDKDDCDVPKRSTKMEASGCCNKARKILKGFAALAELKLTNNEPPLFAQQRVERCLKCDNRTWLNVIKYGTEFLKGVVLKKDLPVNHEVKPYHILACCKCRCCVLPKSLVPEEVCPISKPEWDLAEPETADNKE